MENGNKRRHKRRNEKVITISRMMTKHMNKHKQPKKDLENLLDCCPSVSLSWLESGNAHEKY